MNDKHKLPNIVFIVMDTVGAAHMSLYGYPRRTTPNLDRIADKCTVYNRCFAPGCWTIPSHASMFTGLYPSQHGAHEANLSLSENYQHLVSVLKMAGYRTYGVVSNGLVSQESGLCRDFDQLKVFGGGGFARFQAKFARSKGDAEDGVLPRLTKVLTTKERIKTIIKYFLETHHYRQGFHDLYKIINYKLKRYYDPSPYQKSSKYTKATVSLFHGIINEIYNSKNDEPYFIFLNFLEAHEIYRPPLRSRCFSHLYDKQYRRINALFKESIIKLTDTYRNLHDDEIYFLDHMISNVWRTLEKLPDFDNTLVIITSDHGEHFGEKGLYGHLLSLYNKLIWVPLMVKFPKTLGLEGIDQRLVSLNDLYATILDLINSPLPSPGSSLSLLGSSQRDMVLSQVIFPDLWQGPMRAKKEKDSLFSPPIMAVINDKNKKIIEKANGELEFYDLNKDKNEDHNLIESIPPEAKITLYNLVEHLKTVYGYNDAVNRLKTEQLTDHECLTHEF